MFSRLSESITALFTKRKLDDEALDELEELLILADIPVSTTQEIIKNFSKTRFGKEISEKEIKEALAQEIEKRAEKAVKTLEFKNHKPHVILMVGVNGAGKTTTIGKLAKQWVDLGKKVTLAAGDTFRAAAIEQLSIWAKKAGAHMMSREQGSDAAALVFDAYKESRERRDDILIIDTAGRMQNKEGLMAELEKMVRTLKKIDEEAPHNIILTLDATTGNNALNQAQTFREVMNVDGIILTKLDGTAKGGVVLAITDLLELPIYYIGIGETTEDLKAFKPKEYAHRLVGL